MDELRPPLHPGDPAVTPVLCFTGAHARLPQLLTAIKRTGVPLAVRRCTTLVDFARELTRHEAALVGVDCGPGDLRLRDALAVLRRAGPEAPLVVISEQTPDACAAVAGLGRCVTLAPDDLPGLAEVVRRVRTGAHGLAADDGAPPPAAQPIVDRPAWDGLVGRQELVEALHRVLQGAPARAALAVVRIAPAPDADGGLRRVLAEALGDPPILARIDGDGYAALLELGESSAGVALAHGARARLLHHLGAAGPAAERPVVAIGISPPRAGDGDRAEAWLGRTEQACAVAARTEHGYAVLSGTAATAPSARDIPGLLQEALVGNQLILQFQPIVSLRGDARQHYETLVRLPSTTAGDLLPADFFGPARASGLISAIDHWVIRHAIRRLARERATSRRVHLFIPLSAETLADDRLLLTICDELRSAQAAGDWLTLQLRPADIRARPAQTRRLVEGLRQIRCRLALDRYDGEASCRELLHALAFDFAKLTPELTREVQHDPAQLERLRRVVTELERRGVKSVATGVEDSQSLAYLWTIGIDYAQGFFLHEPSGTIGYDAAG